MNRAAPLLERWRNWRNSRLADPRFQRWAASFPLTRRIAAKRAQALFDICAGFVYSQVLLACVRLDVFQLLQQGPRTLDWIAQRVQLDAAAAARLLDAAVALQLLERCGGGRYGLGELGAALLGNPGAVAMIEHHELLYADLADPVALLRNAKSATRLSEHWPYAQSAQPAALPADRVRDYTRLMATSQSLVARDLIDAYPFWRHRCLLDVGGGDGSFLAAVAASAPRLQLQLFDLPAVVALAREHLASHSLQDRVACTGGSFLTDELPRGADVVSFIRVLHDHDDDSVRKMLAAAARALEPGGTVVIGEPLAGTPGATAMGAAYFGLYLLAMRSGRPRTAAELGALLRASGFIAVQQIATARPLLAGLVIARTPLPERPTSTDVNIP